MIDVRDKKFVMLILNKERKDCLVDTYGTNIHMKGICC